MAAVANAVGSQHGASQAEVPSSGTATRPVVGARAKRHASKLGVGISRAASRSRGTINDLAIQEDLISPLIGPRMAIMPGNLTPVIGRSRGKTGELEP